MRERCIWTKEEVNKAILNVLKTQFKKDCRTAHEIVEDAGYEIIKFDGEWKVKNTKTNKWVKLSKNDNWYDCSRTIYRNTNVGKNAEYNPRKECKFDFVGCLDNDRKPYDPYAEGWRYANKATANYNRLCNAKWRVKYRTERIEEIQKQLADLQKELVYAVKDKVNAEVNLKDIRKELGLEK